MTLRNLSLRLALAVALLTTAGCNLCHKKSCCGTGSCSSASPCCAPPCCDNGVGPAGATAYSVAPGCCNGR